MTDVDAEVSAMQPQLINSEILTKFFKTLNISGGDDEVIDVSDSLEEEPMEYPRKSDLLLALDVLQIFFLFSAIGEVFQAD